jgi:selenocysteine lyase/cysteine desulfurase
LATDLSTATAPARTVADEVRHRFPVFEQVTYVNSCSQGALSDAVRGAYEEYLAGMEAEGSLWETWVDRQERVRGDLATLLGAAPAEVAVTTSASAALSAVASGLDFTSGRDRVVTTDLEFPTVGQIWHAQERRGAQVEHVRSEADHTLSLQRFDEAVDDRTAVVSLTHVCYRNGARTDLEPIIALARERGAYVLVDAYQSAGALPLDVATLDADFVVGGVLKYLLGSPGVGFLYARAGRTDGVVPTATGWFAARDVFAMDASAFDPAPDARRFEAGTPAVPSLYAAAAGIELMLEIGVERTAAHVETLLQALREGVEGLGGTVVTPEAAHGPMLAVASTDDAAHVAALGRERVVTSNRDGNVRISPHCYNTAEDVDAVLAALHAHRSLLR